MGAGAYLLNNNDTVVWFYGQYGDPVPACNITQNPNAAASQSIVGLSVTIEIPAPPPVIAFTVSPSALNFGTLRPGQQSAQNIGINNTGTVGLTITAQVSDNANLFGDNLRLDSQPIQNWHANLPMGQNRNATAALQVPNNFTGAGIRNATLTFWATP